LGACGVQFAALATRSIGVMQQAALDACIIFKHFNATEQHFACLQKWVRAVRSIAYASKDMGFARIFL
jgi:hypothetical protein